MTATFHSTLYQWFDRQKVYLDSLESQLRGLVRAIEIVGKHRQGGGISNKIQMSAVKI